MPIGEAFMKTTELLVRKPARMDLQESIVATSNDGRARMIGWDKTTQSLVMGACSVDLPSIVVSGGAMLTGKFRGKDNGTSDVWRFADDSKKGLISEEEMNMAEAGMCRSIGHCAVMGTASTMAGMVESL